MFLSFNKTGLDDLDFLDGTILATGRVGFDFANDGHAFKDLAEDDVLSVEPGGFGGGDEELGSVGVGSSVSHGKRTDEVLDLEVFILELLAVDALAAHSVAHGDVTALQHELLDDAVEDGVFETETLGASGELTEVFGSLGDGLAEEAHDDAASGFASDGDVKENLVGDFLGIGSENSRSGDGEEDQEDGAKSNGGLDHC